MEKLQNLATLGINHSLYVYKFHSYFVISHAFKVEETLVPVYRIKFDLEYYIVGENLG